MTPESIVEFVRRPGTQADAEFLFDCMKVALGPYVIATYGVWDERWQRDHFTRTTDPEAHEILEIAGSPVGCVLVQEDEAHVDLHRVLLLPPFQNRGIGTRVIRQVLSSARSRGKPTRLQVFRVNPARRLYERLGFVVLGQTKTHYIMLAPPDEASSPLLVQRYGPPGRSVVVLHGGPGAPGGARRLAQALAAPLHVLEPWQRWSSEVPLTVDQHIEDLAGIISEYIPGGRPALVGESWGAMLGLAFASRYPDRISALVLIGCGTFDPQARAQLQRTIEQRTSSELKAQLADLEERFPDDGERFAQAHRLSDSIYTYCRAADVDDPIEHFDLKGHLESWNDMVRLQESGLYPTAFSSIKCPVLMLHGAYDPHPGPMIRDGLKAHIPQLEYREFDQCGHSPWIEEQARERFLAEVRGWLGQQFSG